jgi:hypothetical protein
VVKQGREAAQGRGGGDVRHGFGSSDPGLVLRVIHAAN